MKPAPFRYLRPGDLAEALEMLAADDGARPLAGGQSLLALMNLRLARPTALVDVGRLPLRSVLVVDGGVRIGALVTHRELMRSLPVREHLPLLAAAAGAVGHPAIRSRGTIGGSLAHADPAAEELAAAVALGAEVIVASPRGERRVPISELVLGPWTTCLEHDELVVAVEMPAQPRAWGFSEFSRRMGDFALAGACVVSSGGRLRVAVFGIGQSPRLLDADDTDPSAFAERIAGEVELAHLEDADWRRALVAHEVETAATAALRRAA